MSVCSDFRRRMRLYAQWDLRLAPRTRFFGAAALTNEALAELFSRFTARICLSGSTAGFLTGLGHLLEGVNVRLACEIERGRLTATDLDVRMVACEQSIVEVQLNRLRSTDAGAHLRATAQIDRVLTLVRFAATPARLCASGAAYWSVLRGVGTDLGRSARFALQTDRERIGLGLIRQLRGRAV